jgi:ABC-type Fe3+-siderophore transport system permease subunit
MSPSTCHLISSQTSINHATSAAAERGRMTQLTTIMLEKKNQLTSYLISCVWRKFHFWLRVGCCLLFFCASYSILLSRGGWGRVGHWLCSVIIILHAFSCSYELIYAANNNIWSRLLMMITMEKTGHLTSYQELCVWSWLLFSLFLCKLCYASELWSLGERLDNDCAVL